MNGFSLHIEPPSYVGCINCSYNNVAKGILLLDKKKHFLFIQDKFHAGKSFRKIYPLKHVSLEKCCSEVV